MSTGNVFGTLNDKVMNVVLEDCIILLKLYCLALLSLASCYKDCLLSNNEKPIQRAHQHAYRRKMTTPFPTPEPPFDVPQEGPPRNAEYDPTFGYEPYWATGDWVFEVQPQATGDMCGEACSLHLRNYGVICGRRRDRKLSMEHRTFKNYCEMMNADCERKDVWLIAYRGECRPTPKTYPTQGASFVTRAMAYIPLFLAHTAPKRLKTRRTGRRTTSTNGTKTTTP